MTLQDDNELMTAVRDGDTRLMAVLFERHHRAVFHFFLRLTGRKELSEDLVQDVFYRLLKARHTYREGFPFTAWMYQVARNAHIDHLRKRRGDTYSLDDTEQKWPEPVETAPHPEQSLSDQEEIALLQQALASLPAEKREILVLSRFQELKYDEIARILDVEVNTVKVRIFRAVKQLGTAYQALVAQRTA